MQEGSRKQDRIGDQEAVVQQHAADTFDPHPPGTLCGRRCFELLFKNRRLTEPPKTPALQQDNLLVQRIRKGRRRKSSWTEGILSVRSKVGNRVRHQEFAFQRRNITALALTFRCFIARSRQTFIQRAPRKFVPLGTNPRILIQPTNRRRDILMPSGARRAPASRHPATAPDIFSANFRLN